MGAGPIPIHASTATTPALAGSAAVFAYVSAIQSDVAANQQYAVSGWWVPDSATAPPELTATNSGLLMDAASWRNFPSARARQSDASNESDESDRPDEPDGSDESDDS